MILWSSAIIGYLLRHWPQVWVSRLLAISIFQRPSISDIVLLHIILADMVVKVGKIIST